MTIPHFPLRVRTRTPSTNPSLIVAMLKIVSPVKSMFMLNIYFCMKRFGLFIATFFLALQTKPAHAPVYPELPASEADFEQAVNKKIELNSYWIIPPDIIICDRVATVSRVKTALRFWERLGYEFGEIREERDALNCNLDVPGTIKIMLPSTTDDMQNRLAITLTHKFMTTSEAIHSEIKIHSFAVNMGLVLEHEIGHSLGWLHASRKGHVMYPEYDHIGSNASGVDYVEYTKLTYDKVTTPTSF